LAQARRQTLGPYVRLAVAQRRLPLGVSPAPSALDRGVNAFLSLIETAKTRRWAIPTLAISAFST
jgi:hypothetical protein